MVFSRILELFRWSDREREIVPSPSHDRSTSRNESRNVLDRHFALMEEIRDNYRKRNDNPRFLNQAIAACKRQIALAPEAAEAFRNEPGGTRGLPAHTGFEQLAIIYEKQGKIEDALAVTLEAKSQGWGQGCTKGPVDWDKRIARLKKKMGKSD